MTDSPTGGLSTAGEPALEHALGPPDPSPDQEPTAPPFLRLNSMRRAASASRTYGRFAVGLRPILDPDAYLGAPERRRSKGKRKINDQIQIRTGS